MILNTRVSYRLTAHSSGIGNQLCSGKKLHRWGKLCVIFEYSLNLSYRSGPMNQNFRKN